MQAPFRDKSNSRLSKACTRSKLNMFYLAPLAVFAFAFFSLQAQATITITDVKNASNVEGLGTSTLIIYGGFAGSTDQCDQPPDPTRTCDNCSTTPSATGDAGLLACNDHRAHAGLELTISFKSDTKDGVPTVLANDISGGTPVALPTVSSSTAVVTKGTVTTVTVTWGSICNYAPVAGGTANTPSNDSTCAFTGGPPGPVTLSVGVLAAADSPSSKANSDFTPVNFTLVQEVGQKNSHPTVTDQSLGGDCDSASTTSAYGVCHFEAYPGDGKAYILNLQGLNGFPNQTGVTGGVVFRKVRILAAQGGYDKVVKSSKIEDLDITTPDTAATTSSSASPGVGLAVSPDRVTGGLENGKSYFFKAAVIDAAGNVGYYTPSTADSYCKYATAGRTTPCHEATPDEVAGILSKTLNCFVATAAYGSNMAPQVEIFRQFRNRILLKQNWGISFVKFYYEHSPKYANIIAHHEALRTLARVALWPLLAYAWLALQIGGWPTFILFSAVLLGTPTYFLVRRQIRA
jgi:hypothetical protein